MHPTTVITLKRAAAISVTSTTLILFAFLLSCPPLAPAVQTTAGDTSGVDGPGVTVTGPAMPAAPEDAAEILEPPVADGDASVDPDALGVPSTDPAPTIAPTSEDAVPDNAPSDVVSNGAAQAQDLESDATPTGPDMTLAEATGMPMAGGVSADPMEALLEVVASQQEDGLAVQVIEADFETGKIVYTDGDANGTA